MARKAEYGRGRPAFLEYVKFIAEHPVYAGMPDAYLETGEVQWETPSNRTGGKFKDSHLKRLNWWRQKAQSIGVNPTTEATWISRTAKAIHPTKEKPCKNCGRVMDIRYVYPSGHLAARIGRLSYYDESFPLDPNEKVTDLVARLVEQFGQRVFADLPKLFAVTGVAIPAIAPTLDAWSKWLLEKYVPLEPKTLSPGAMSNAPDRFDGFHSFNRCCRSKADKGRSRENLQSYTTDRRVFEYWVDGDWVAADRLMGLIRSEVSLKSEMCFNGHSGPCAADHIGPISLGFVHRPEFRLLCGACNSAKNNRMPLRDVVHLRDTERSGERVASWYCQHLWDLRKASVTNEETAGRLSKLFRDNRHTVMFILDRFARAGHFTFLASFLGLQYADTDPTFENLRAEGHVTTFDKLNPGTRVTKYAVEQKARRVRVAFAALHDYINKPSRNAFQVTSPAIEEAIVAALSALSQTPAGILALDRELSAILGSEAPSEESLRAIVPRLPTTNLPPAFARARASLETAMRLVGEQLSGQWDADRYLRAGIGEEVD